VGHNRLRRCFLEPRVCLLLKRMNQLPRHRLLAGDPDWRSYSPHQLSVLMFLHGYPREPAEDFDLEAALSSALEAREETA
jgi:hypothetical protein